MMQTLQLPTCPHKIIKKNAKNYIFDILRKKYVHLTPEEWVRQHIVHYLINHLAYPPGLMCVETSAKYHTTQPQQRTDITIYTTQPSPTMIIECKAPQQKLNNTTLRQMLRYNSSRVPYLLFTNGTQHACFHLAQKSNSYTLLQEIPHFEHLKKGS